VSDPRWKETDLDRPSEVAPEATSRMLRVPPELAGTRLDVFLRLSLRSTSRTRAKRIAKQAAFDVNGHRMRPNQRLKPDEHIVLWRVPLDRIDDQIELPELYRDQHILAIDKPADLTVHPTASHYYNTVTKLLEHHHPGHYFSLIHRLDRDTSGVLLVGLTREADRAFKMLLEGTLDVPAGVDPRVGKTYLAITWGVPKDGPITLPLERDPLNSLRVKMRVAEPGSGLEAHTDVRVLDRCDGYALVECRLLTGRQHQIRLHLSALGTPVVGDKLYGPNERLHARAADGQLTEEDNACLEVPRQALHAWRYQLVHALNWQRLDVIAPLPRDMRLFWRRVSGRSTNDIATQPISTP
jgi:23S rRNA pseudouridine1911/1915/1917 synthase